MTDLPLWSAAAAEAETRAGLACAVLAGARLAEVLDALVPLARELAAARPDGVTVADVRSEAERRGVLAVVSRGRRLAGLGVLMQRAGLVPTGARRRSHLPGSHGNLHTVWRMA